jgi:hypothetical protein
VWRLSSRSIHSDTDTDNRNLNRNLNLNDNLNDSNTITHAVTIRAQTVRLKQGGVKGGHE